MATTADINNWLNPQQINLANSSQTMPAAYSPITTDPQKINLGNSGGGMLQAASPSSAPTDPAAGSSASFSPSGIFGTPSAFDSAMNGTLGIGGNVPSPAQIGALTPSQTEAMKNNQQNDSIFTPIADYIKANSGQMFAAALSAAGAGVLGYLADRRKARDAAAMRAQEMSFLTNQRNADVQRASAVPVVGSMINKAAVPQTGLLGQVQAR